MGTESNLRLFVAVDADKIIRSKADAARKALDGSLSSVRWVGTEKIHLTLRFLGDVGAERVDWLASALRSGLEGSRSFQAETSSFGTFPDSRKARVIWLGIKESEECLALQKKTNAALLEVGILAERRSFRPHFTIARLKRPCSVPLDKVEHLTRTAHRLTIDSVMLYSSTLRPEGPVYERLARISLRPEQHP